MAATPATSPLRRMSRGFTLIELLIILVIVGALGSLAVPAYSRYASSARRVDATAGLEKLIAQQELYYNNYGSTYTSNVTDLGFVKVGVNSKMSSKDGYYLIQLGVCEAGGSLTDCVNATATAVAGNKQSIDLQCQSFSQNTRGLRTATDSAGNSNTGTYQDCW